MELKHIMMIDDDEEDIEIFREFVKKCELPIEVYHCNEANEGIAKMKSMPAVDVLFVDSQMNVMSGVEVIAIIKNDEQLKHVPVVLLSSGFSQSAIKQAMDMGAFSCVTKSNDYMVYCNELLKVIHSQPTGAADAAPVSQVE